MDASGTSPVSSPQVEAAPAVVESEPVFVVQVASPSLTQGAETSAVQAVGPSAAEAASPATPAPLNVLSGGENEKPLAELDESSVGEQSAMRQENPSLSEMSERAVLAEAAARLAAVQAEERRRVEQHRVQMELLNRQLEDQENRNRLKLRRTKLEIQVLELERDIKDWQLRAAQARR